MIRDILREAGYRRAVAELLGYLFLMGALLALVLLAAPWVASL